MQRILIIDDEVELARLFGLVLTDAGHEIELAHDGVAGLRALEQGGADLVITDLVLPERDGIELIGVIRERWPAIALIAVSGGGRITSDQYLELADKLGVDRSFAKPVDLDALTLAVGELLADPR